MKNEKKIFVEQAQIIHRENRSPDSCLMHLKAPHIASNIQPGQFVNVLPPGQADYSAGYYVVNAHGIPRQTGSNTKNPLHFALLRRPFSLHGLITQEIGLPPEIFSILFRIKGKGTVLIADQPLDKTLNILGPLGTPYLLPHSVSQPVFVVAGGFGIAPLIPLAEILQRRGHQVYFFWGAEEANTLPVKVNQSTPSVSLSHLRITSLETRGIESLVAIRQGGLGSFKGTVVELFARWIKEHHLEHDQPPLVYTCGPEGMMKKIAGFAAEHEWACRVSLEKYMACGMGACLSCVCTMNDLDDPSTVHYQRTCTDGPSFWGEQVLWEP